MRPKIAVIHGVTDPTRPDEADTIAQVHAVADAVARLGWQVDIVAMDLDLTSVAQLARKKPAMVFNLVEALDGHGHLLHVVPRMLDDASLAYTGSDTTALFTTSHKPIAKQLMRAAGLPTPGWSSTGRDLRGTGKVIVKAAWEDASYGLDQESVVDAVDAATEISRRQAQFRTDFFAEDFIPGREFNLSLLEGADGLSVLPAAEIRFDENTANPFNIVDYAAKWDPAAASYHGTPRSFAFPPEDALLIERLDELARACWDLFGLSGYARVDFRVDAAGQPWILEVNANPCLTPDAGFAAAAAQSGIGFDELISAILGLASARTASAA
ncbi:MAG: D-alanine--D-alanine ligase [Proteobacteria bacterium]|nr:D-alanine--D-alanine ligase [Pseudomonadota bacterium]